MGKEKFEQKPLKAINMREAAASAPSSYGAPLLKGIPPVRVRYDTIMQRRPISLDRACRSNGQLLGSRFEPRRSDDAGASTEPGESELNPGLVLQVHLLTRLPIVNSRLDIKCHFCLKKNNNQNISFESSSISLFNSRVSPRFSLSLSPTLPARKTNKPA